VLSVGTEFREYSNGREQAYDIAPHERLLDCVLEFGSLAKSPVPALQKGSHNRVQIMKGSLQVALPSHVECILFARGHQYRRRCMASIFCLAGVRRVWTRKCYLIVNAIFGFERVHDSIHERVVAHFFTELCEVAHWRTHRRDTFRNHCILSHVNISISKKAPCTERAQQQRKFISLRNKNVPCSPSTNLPVSQVS
jgi:hypothetical protein